MTPLITTVRGKDLKVGMTLVYLATPNNCIGHPKLITGFGRRYRHPALDDAMIRLTGECRTAESGDWGVTIFDRKFYEILDPEAA